MGPFGTAKVLNLLTYYSSSLSYKLITKQIGLQIKKMHSKSLFIMYSKFRLIQSLFYKKCEKNSDLFKNILLSILFVCMNEGSCIRFYQQDRQSGIIPFVTNYLLDTLLVTSVSKSVKYQLLPAPSSALPSNKCVLLRKSANNINICLVVST